MVPSIKPAIIKRALARRSHLSPGKAGGLNETVNRSKRIENHEPPEGSVYSNIFN